MTDANFKSKLYLRSIIATTAITVNPIIYLSNGMKIPLAAVNLDPDGVAVVDLNDELAKQGISSFATLSGYVEVQYNWPWSPICAMVRAFDPVHSLLFFYNLQPSLHVALPKFEPGQAPIQPPAPTPAAHTVEGLWWKQEANVTGFVGLANTTGQPLTATVNVSDQQSNSIAQHTVTISSHGMKLVELAELASASSSSGGITVNYNGLRDDLLVDGALQDQAVGYSAMLPFTFVDTQPQDATQMSFVEMGLMVGAADPMMSFPAGTTFTPYSVLRNISDTPITANPTLWWMASGTAQYADIPAITLAPHQSQLLDMTSILASGGLANFTGSVNLVFDVQAKPGSFVVSAGSVDQTNNYVFAVYPRGVKESASKSLSYWTTANGDDTMVTLWNPADETQNFIFQINYVGGHYLLPIQLGPKATRTFNISDVIRSGVPDSEGNVIPPNVQEGSAVLMGSQAKIEHILVAVDAATYNVKKATCGGECWYCEGVSEALVDLYNFGVFANGGQTQESLIGIWDDGAWQNDYTSESSWYSDNQSVMTVSAGMVTGQAAGTADIYASDDVLPIYNPNYCCVNCLYCETGIGAGSPGAVVPTISGPNTVWWFGGQQFVSGYSTSITLTSSGGSGTIWAVVAGANKVNISPTGSTVTVTSSGTSFSASVGDIQITAQANFEISAPFNITTRTPYRLTNREVSPTCDTGFGYLDFISYNIQDQLLTNIPSAVPWNEEWTSSIVDDDAPYDNWSLFGQPPETPATGTVLVDQISGVGINNTPTPSPMPACSGTPIKIQHWGQEFRVGSTSSGFGQPVQTDNLTRFNEHAEHD